MENHSGKMVSDALQRLASQWHIDSDHMHEKRRELQALLTEVKRERFIEAITVTIRTHKGEFCPTIAMIRANTPERKDTSRMFTPTPEMIQDRREHSEDYWGEADVKAIWKENMLRKANKQPLLTVQECYELVKAAREKYSTARNSKIGAAEERNRT